MNKPVGGRGHKAPYATATVRVPIDIKPQIDELSARFRAGNLETAKSEDEKISQLITIIERYQAKSTTSRDWTQANKLIQELAAQIEQF